VSGNALIISSHCVSKPVSLFLAHDAACIVIIWSYYTHPNPGHGTGCSSFTEIVSIHWPDRTANRELPRTL